MNQPASKLIRSYAVSRLWRDRWLAEAALQRRCVSTEQLANFSEHGSAWAALAAAGMTDEALVELACLISATSAADLSRVGPADALLLPQFDAEQHGVIGVRTDGPTIVVATSNPLSSTLQRDLILITRHRIELVTASPDAISEARRRVYSGKPTPPSGFEAARASERVLRLVSL